MKITKKCIVAIGSCVLLILQAFGLKFDLPLLNEAIATLASILVMLGIVTDSTPPSDSTTQAEETPPADGQTTETAEVKTEQIETE